METINNFISLERIDNNILHFRFHKVFPNTKEYQKVMDIICDKLENRSNAETLVVIFDVKILALFTAECQNLAISFAQNFIHHSLFVVFYNTSLLLQFSLKEMRKDSSFPFPIFITPDYELAKFRASQILTDYVY
jgi:hypothetical protein